MASALVLISGVLLNRLLSAAPSESHTDWNSSRRTIAAAVTAFLLVAYCLFLTKSRTAWGGALVGLATLIFLLITKSAGISPRRVIPIVVSGAIALSLLAGVAVAAGALDIEVLSEAPMSLRYRLEYWTSTWDVFLDQPLFGTGPGNFRDHYLRYKLPQSSEEIADPHQFILDVAANAGLIGLIGLAAVFAMLAKLAWSIARSRKDGMTSQNGPDNAPEVSAVDSCWKAVAIAASLTLVGEWLFSATVSWHVLSIGLLAIGIEKLLAVLQRKSASSIVADNLQLRIPPVAIVAALVTIFVHLSAAGGIAMPAVIGLIFALASVLSVDAERASAGNNQQAAVTVDDVANKEAATRLSDAPFSGVWLGTALFGGLAAVGCTMTAFVPVTQSASLLQIGDYEAVNGQPVRQVISLYNSAAAADPLSPEPHIRLTQVYLHQWKQTRDEQFFVRAIESAQQARALSPNNPQIAHEIGHAWLMRAAAERPNQQAAASAVAELQKALAMYPTQPAWTADTAQALALSGEADEAAALARRALEFDEINRAAGHADRYLPDERLAEIKRLADAS